MSIRQVIVSLGGISALARGLGHRNPSTVQGWWERDVIPAHQQAFVLEAARVAGLGLEPSDLIPGFRASPEIIEQTAELSATAFRSGHA